MVSWSLAPHTFSFCHIPPHTHTSSGPVHSRPFQMPLTVLSLISVIPSGAVTASSLNLFLFNSLWKTSGGTGLKISCLKYTLTLFYYSPWVLNFFVFLHVRGVQIFLEGHQGQEMLLHTKGTVLRFFVRLLLSVM